MSDCFHNERIHLYECLDLLRQGFFDFDALALKIFDFQYKYNQVYQSYVDNLNIDASNIRLRSQIPFLPISAFKHHNVLVDGVDAEIVFTSSGTTTDTRSQHSVIDLHAYLDNCRFCFESFFKERLESFCFIALLPSYMDRPGSSLIEMMKYFIKQSTHPDSGFYHNREDFMIECLRKLDKSGQKTILIGVSYALLDLIDREQLVLSNVLVMETGGMKGRRKEQTKQQLHDLLCRGLGVNAIASEYGMTELLSQCYSDGNGRFYTPATMDVEIREINDPLARRPIDKSGQIYITDLANIDSSAFIVSDDIGMKKNASSFEILGRLDYSDRRGCNLLLEEIQ